MNTGVTTQGVATRDEYAKSKVLNAPSNLSQHDREKGIPESVKAKIRDIFTPNPQMPLTGGQAVQVHGNQVAVRFPPPILTSDVNSVQVTVTGCLNGVPASGVAWYKTAPTAL